MLLVINEGQYRSQSHQDHEEIYFVLVDATLIN